MQHSRHTRAGETAKKSPVVDRTYFNDVHRFNGRSWSAVKSVARATNTQAFEPLGRSDHSATAFGPSTSDNIFFFGGRSPFAHRLHYAATMPLNLLHRRHQHSFLDDSFVLAGTRSEGVRWVPLYTRLNPSGRRGHAVVQCGIHLARPCRIRLSSYVCAPNCAAQSEKLYLYGGQRGALYLNDLWEFDTGSLVWSPLRSKGPHRRSLLLIPCVCPQQTSLFPFADSLLHCTGSVPSGRAFHAIISPLPNTIMVRPVFNLPPTRPFDTLCISPGGWWRASKRDVPTGALRF
jgi:hypothetical protein